MLKDFETEGQRLTEMESKVLSARQNGFSLFQLPDQEFKDFVSGLVFKVAAMTGIKLPTSEDYCEELETELGKHLLEIFFKELTIDEVYLALRVNLPTSASQFRLPSGMSLERIEPFGDCVSVEYISQVLKNYKTIRNTIDRKLQNFIDGIGFNY